MKLLVNENMKAVASVRQLQSPELPAVQASAVYPPNVAPPTVFATKKFAPRLSHFEFQLRRKGNAAHNLNRRNFT